MKLAFFTPGCPEFSLEYAIEQAAAWGFCGIEIRGIKDCMRADRIGELCAEKKAQTLTMP